MNRYLILLTPRRESFLQAATAEEMAVVERHFEYLQGLLAAGRLILAGRCEEGRRASSCLRRNRTKPPGRSSPAAERRRGHKPLGFPASRQDACGTCAARPRAPAHSHIRVIQHLPACRGTV